jgi:hypothetical protein
VQQLKGMDQKNKLLLAITQGRDIPQFLEATAKIKGYDKLWVKYYPAYMAYKIIKSFFLDHPEYSHLALLADDLIVKQQDIDQLWYDVNKINGPGSMFQHCVLSGCCNVDLTTWKDYLNVSFELPIRSSYGRRYDFMRKDDPIAVEKRGCVQVGFCGTALIVIPRQYVSKLSFDNDAKWSGLSEEMGCCQDVIMCNDLHDLGVKMFVDFRVNMLHLKQFDGIWFPLSTGVKSPYRKLEVAK